MINYINFKKEGAMVLINAKIIEAAKKEAETMLLTEENTRPLFLNEEEKKDGNPSTILISSDEQDLTGAVPFEVKGKKLFVGIRKISQIR